MEGGGKEGGRRGGRHNILHEGSELEEGVKYGMRMDIMSTVDRY